MALALVLLPLLLAAIAGAVPSNRWRPWLVPIGGFAHLALVIAAFGMPAPTAAHGWLVLDSLGKVILCVTSVLFAVSSIGVPHFLAARERSNRIFCACMLAFLSMMTLIAESHHLGLTWVAVESTTLASAPLIYFDRNPRSLEATWKYLLLCSVGIAVALLGSFFLSYAALRSGLPTSLLVEDLVRAAPHLSRPWLESAFILLFVGYGTKMGLAPMHSWLPDAHSEAPSLVSALLSGALLNCAFLAILRVYQICAAAGDTAFARRTMILIGLLSMAVASVFMLRQRDYKRMLAYSSVEHMGILVLGVGVGGLAAFGALLHLVNNGLTKGLLFLTAGNLHHAYGSKNTDEVQGALRRVPVSGALFVCGFLAITGSPPFGPFWSEFTILRGALGGGQLVTGGLMLFFLAVIFFGMAVTVLAVTQGRPRETSTTGHGRHGAHGGREALVTIAPPLAFLALVVLLGVTIPGPVDRLLHAAAASLEGQP